MKLITSVIIVIGLLIVLSNAAFLVPEGQQALITQFGKVQGNPITKAGLKFKTPFLQDVRFFDKRILSWDGDADKIPTKDKKYIWVDTTARWKIVDPLKFTRTLRSEARARSSIDDVLDGITRDIISSFTLVEAVRNSNTILNVINERKKKIKENKEKIRQQEAAAKQELTSAKVTESKIAIAMEEEVTGEIARITAGREELTKLITTRARKELHNFGIELIDVQLRSIAYDESVQQKVYARMISERERIAEKIRSFGQGELQKIQGKLDRDLKKIESVAYRKSQTIKGKAQAEAIQIYARSFGSDPSFYEFSKNLELYKKALSKKGELILSTENKFLKLLNTGSN